MNVLHGLRLRRAAILIFHCSSKRATIIGIYLSSARAYCQGFQRLRSKCQGDNNFGYSTSEPLGSPPQPCLSSAGYDKGDLAEKGKLASESGVVKVLLLDHTS